MIHEEVLTRNPELAEQLTHALVTGELALPEVDAPATPPTRDLSSMPGWHPGFKPLGPEGGAFVTAEGAVSGR